jgi:PAS domain S-box-containing protein
MAPPTQPLKSADQEWSLLDLDEFKRMLDAQSIVAITDPQGTIIHVNHRFSEVSRYPREELIGRDIRILNSNYHSKTFMGNLWATVSKGETWKGLFRNRAKDGTTYWVDTTIMAFFNKDGILHHLVSVGTDVTERTLLDTAEAHLSAIIDSSHDAIVGKDLGGVVLSWNRGAERIFGYSAEEMVGHSVIRLFPPERIDEEMSILRRIAKGESVPPFDTVRLRKDGSRVHVSVSTSPIRDPQGTIIGASKIARDVSERVRAEERIQQLNESLQRRMEERNAELYALSHSVAQDLQAPLRAVIGFARAVVDDFGPQLPEECRRLVVTIQGSAERMSEMIHQLSRFARIGREELEKQAFRTSDLVRSALEELGSPWPDRTVAVVVGELPISHGDPSLMKQVWLNLLSNALKFTSRKPQAQIEVGSLELGGHRTFFVRDNGSGFDMRYLDRLFVIFQRLHSRDEFEGDGVGLAIVRRIVVRHGGRVWAEAVPGGGATFFFTLEGEPPA